MNPLRSPLYRRLLLWFCAANIATLLVSVFVTERVSRMAYVAEPDWDALAQQADAEYLRGGTEALDRWSDARRDEGIDATLFEGQRNLLDRPLPPPLRHALDKLLVEDNLVLRRRHDSLVASQSVTGSDGVERHLIAARGPPPPHAPLAQLLFVQIALSLLVIAALGWWIARSIARPVAALQQATQRMAAGELSARVGPSGTAGGDELARLSRDFDRMASRIESLVTTERSLLQDVSHELRSPLARLHLLLDLARYAPADEAGTHFERAEREIARLDRLIGEALALTRLETELPGSQHETVDLSALLRQCCADAGIEAQSRSVDLQLADVPAALRAGGSASLLERAIDNLLSNAIKFSPLGGVVTLTLQLIDGRIELAIRDHGPGVPAAELDSLFRPFFRGHNADLAEGHGLGLTIVQRIARAHGGTASASNAEGGGLRVVLVLPATATR